MPLVLPETTYEWWGHAIGPPTRARHHNPRLPAPSRPASAAPALDDRRAGSPRARRRPPSRVTPPKDRVHGGRLSRGQQLSRRQGDACRRRSRRRDGWSDQRREQPRSRSREPPAAFTSGRQMRTMHQRRRPKSVQIPRWKRSRSRERDQDRQQLAVMNAASFPQGHDRAAAIRRLGNHGRRARGVRIRRSEQRLRARVRRTIRARWNLNFAWRRSMPGIAEVGRSKRRPRSSCCWHCRCRSVRSLDGAIRTRVPMRSRSAMVQVCDATPHRCGVRRCRQLHAVGRRPARRHCVAAAWCLPRVGLRRVRRTSSASAARAVAAAAGGAHASRSDGQMGGAARAAPRHVCAGTHRRQGARREEAIVRREQHD